MAAAQIVGTPAESATTTAGTSHVVNLPAGAVGNLFLMILGKGSTSATINALTGWNELVDESQAWGGYVAWRAVDGTEGATTTFTSSASTKTTTIVFEISGAANPATRAPEISAVGTGTSNAPDPNTVTPTGGAKDYLWITFFILGAAGEELDDDTWCNNAATGFGSLVQKASGTAGTNIGAYIAASSLASNAASMNAVWPASTTDQSLAWRAWTIAVHPDDTRRAQVSWAEFEAPNAPRRALMSWAELEVPNGPRRAYVSWAELEVPTAPRRAQVSWAELEIPIAPRRALVSWAELQVPDLVVGQRAQVSWAELEVPNAPRRAQVSWAEMQVPDGPRRAYVSWAEFEAPEPPARRAFVSWAELQVPNAVEQEDVESYNDLTGSMSLRLR